MEEIQKFRAWDGLNKKFTYWTMNDLCTWEGKEEKPSALDNWQRFTGLLDNDREEVYEGDIVRSSDGMDSYVDKIRISNIHGIMFGRERYADLVLPHGFYIIGNEWENHDLLK